MCHVTHTGHPLANIGQGPLPDLGMVQMTGPTMTALGGHLDQPAETATIPGRIVHQVTVVVVVAGVVMTPATGARVDAIQLLGGIIPSHREEVVKCPSRAWSVGIAEASMNLLHATYSKRP